MSQAMHPATVHEDGKVPHFNLAFLRHGFRVPRGALFLTQWCIHRLIETRTKNNIAMPHFVQTCPCPWLTFLDPCRLSARPPCGSCGVQELDDSEYSFAAQL